MVSPPGPRSNCCVIFHVDQQRYFGYFSLENTSEVGILQGNTIKGLLNVKIAANR